MAVSNPNIPQIIWEFVEKPEDLGNQALACLRLKYRIACQAGLRPKLG